MKNLILIAMLAACSKEPAHQSAAVAPAMPTPVPVTTTAAARVVEIAKGGDFDALVAAEAVRARKDGLVPFVELTAGWCPPCKAIKKLVDEREPRMMDAFAGTAIIQVDFDAYTAAAEKLGVSAIPAFLALDDQNHVTARRIDGGAWDDNVAENMAPPLKKFLHASH